METISAPNALNRQMQNLWSAHRRNKLNINATPPSPKANTTSEDISTPQTAQNIDTTSTSIASTDASTSKAPAPSDTPPTAEDSQNTNPSSSINAKRKLRSSRTDQTVKRSRTAGSASASTSGGGTIAKDYTPPSLRLSDLGGVEACIEKVLELVAMPLCHPEIYLHTGIPPPRGVLLHGPPGCGKTMLANAIAGELGVPFINISAPSVVSGMSGESEKTLRDTFEEAKRVAPCLLFIDEIDAITPKRESAQREMERRIVAQFLTCMDDMSWEKNDNKPVIVIGATNRPDALDAALRRAGRFDHEISMGVPDEEARAKILRVLCAKLRLEGDFNFDAMAKATPGYVGADLSALTSAAGIIAVKRIFKQISDGVLVLPLDFLPPPDGVQGSGANEKPTQSLAPEPDSMVVDSTPPALSQPDQQAQLQHPQLNLTSQGPLSSVLAFPGALGSIAHFLNAHPDPLTEAQLAPIFITSSDFQDALKKVQPSSKREGFATVPDVSWSDIGALHGIREELQMAIVQPIKRPELFSAVGIEAACGVLLWGPPGCGKTLLAKAVANESRANFISIKGPELLNKYVGESERAVRQVFSRARASSPCVVFFDELDALVPRRDDSLSESSARVVNTLLTELDGLDSRKAVYVIAATNRPDMIDPAMVRPGRLDKLLYVDLPSPEERTEIIRTLCRRVPLGLVDELGVVEMNDDIHARVRQEVEALVKDGCDGHSGADLASVVREAGVVALKRTLGALDKIESEGSTVSASTKVVVTIRDFCNALDKVGPSVSVAQRKRYEALRNKFAGLPVRARQVRLEEEPKL